MINKITKVCNFVINQTIFYSNTYVCKYLPIFYYKITTVSQALFVFFTYFIFIFKIVKYYAFPLTRYQLLLLKNVHVYT